MKSNFRNITILFVVSFLFLTLYQGIYNLMYFRSISSYNHPAPDDKMDILLMGFRNSKSMTYFAILAILFSLIAKYYLQKRQTVDTLSRKAIILSLNLTGLLFLYRLFFAIAGRYLELNTIKQIIISSLILFVSFFLVILPTIFLLQKLNVAEKKE